MRNCIEQIGITPPRQGQTFSGLVWPEGEKASEGLQKPTGLNFLFEVFMAAE